MQARIARPRAVAAIALVLAAAGIYFLWIGRGELERAGAAVQPPASGMDSAATSPPAPRADPAERHTAGGGRAALAAPPEDRARGAEDASEEASDPRVLSGTVVDPEGRPVGGARVLRYPLLSAQVDLGQPLGEATTDARGAFRFEDCEAFDRALLFVHAAGFFPAVARDALAGRAQRLVLERAQPFSGRVLDEASGRPLAGVLVRLAMHWGGVEALFDFEAEARTDAEGRYALPAGRLGGTQGLSLEAAGTPPIRRTVTIRAGVFEGYELWLPAERSITLALVDAASLEPLPHAEIELVGWGALRADAEGRVDVRARVSGERVSFLARSPRRCMTSLDVRLPPEDPVELVLPLELAGRLELLVLDARGQPIPGASALVSSALGRGGGGQDSPSIMTPIPFAPAGEDGRIAIDSVPGLELRLRVSAPGRTSGTVELEVPQPPELARRTVVLPRGATIEGRVTRAGRPVRGWVTWSHEDGMHGARAQSIDDGSFRLEGVLAGRVCLHAREETDHESRSAEEGEWLDVEDEAVLRRDLEILRETAVISGIVRDEAGRAVSGAELSASAPELGFRRATSDGEGRFRLVVRDVPGALYSVGARAFGHGVETDGVRAGTLDLELVLPRLGALRLLVLDAQTRAPLEYPAHFFRRAGAEAFEAVSRFLPRDPDGAVVAPLPAGLLDLRISAREQGYVAGRLDGILVPALDLSAAQETADEEGRAALPEHVVLLERGARLEILFQPWDPDPTAQRSYPMLLVTPERAAALARDGHDAFHNETWWHDALVPDAEGRCVLTGLAPGEHVFRIVPEGLVLDPPTIDVPRAPRHEVTVRLREKDP